MLGWTTEPMRTQQATCAPQQRATSSVGRLVRTPESALDEFVWEGTVDPLAVRWRNGTVGRCRPLVDNDRVGDDPRDVDRSGARQGLAPGLRAAMDRAASWSAAAHRRPVPVAVREASPRSTRPDRLIDHPCQIRGGGTESLAERPTITAAQSLDLANRMPDQYRPLVLLAVFGSLRWGELTALRRSDIDVERGSVTVRGALSERATGEMVLGSPRSPPDFEP